MLMRVLTLDSALARVSAAVLDGAAPLSVRLRGAERGQGTLLAAMAEEVLREATSPACALEAVAVTVGPGSFTGIRAALSLAHGIALAADIPIVGVTVGEALAAAQGRQPGADTWIAIDNRRGRVFLETEAGLAAVDLHRLPLPACPVAVLGDAADAVASLLRTQGAEAIVVGPPWPEPAGIAGAARERLAGRLPPRPAQPVYIDPPEARPPPGGLRPPPV
jgi:tRNA threonylcarbamoyladenosine biosynthesis protein TsaB